MLKVIFRKILVAFCTAVPLFCVSCKKENAKTELVVLAAASLTDVCGQIKTVYEEKNPSVTLLFSFGGSGALKAQIEAGVPADVFLSAATQQMESLQKQGLMTEGSVKNLLQNQVVLIAPKKNDTKISSFAELSSPEIKLVALGESESVPAGLYAKSIFQFLGIWDEVRAKANFAGDVRTVLSWVESSACEYGVVYATDAASSSSVRVIANAPEKSCPPVIYPVGIVRASEKQMEAASFVDFLFSDEVKSIFEKAGFVTLSE